MSDLARCLRDWVRRSGLQQGEIAVRVGVTGPAVSHWLSGRVRPTPRNLRALAMVCDRSPRQLAVALQMLTVGD